MDSQDRKSVRWGALVGETSDGWQEIEGIAGGNTCGYFLLPRVLPASSWYATVFSLSVACRLESHLKIWHLLTKRPGELFVLYIITVFVCVSMTKVLRP